MQRLWDCSPGLHRLWSLQGRRLDPDPSTAGHVCRPTNCWRGNIRPTISPVGWSAEKGCAALSLLVLQPACAQSILCSPVLFAAGAASLGLRSGLSALDRDLSGAIADLPILVSVCRPTNFLGWLVTACLDLRSVGRSLASAGDWWVSCAACCTITTNTIDTTSTPALPAPAAPSATQCGCSAQAQPTPPNSPAPL